MAQARLNVKLLAHTPELEKIIAMAGKLCYSSSSISDLEDKLTEANIEKFIKMIMGIGHESILEHCSFTFAIEGVSRCLTHQLIRHRIASYSQQSQRYVKLDSFEYIIPKDIENIEYLKQRYIKNMDTIQDMYDNYVNELMDNYCYDYLVEETGLCSADIQQDSEIMHTVMKSHNKKMYNAFEKKAIENARYVLPNACETKIIVTMNIRTLIHFFQQRICSRAQEEIQSMAREILTQCREVSPIIFNHVGAPCFMYNKCPEGKMSCGNMQTK
jgi:thymidylate synthase (FAD)